MVVVMVVAVVVFSGECLVELGIDVDLVVELGVNVDLVVELGVDVVVVVVEGDV